MMEVELGSRALGWVLLLGSVAGWAAVAVGARVVDVRKLRVEANKIVAYLLEFRLYADDPLLVWQAQRKLFFANYRSLRILLLPSLLLAVPFAALVAVLDGFFANAPLTVGEPAVVTAEFTNIPDSVHLEAWPSVAVRVVQERQISWRIVPEAVQTTPLKLTWGGQSFEKTLTFGTGLRWISTERSNSWIAFLRHPHERPFSDSNGKLIRVQYPKAVIFGAHWLVWFTAATFAGSLLSTLKFQGFRSYV